MRKLERRPLPHTALLVLALLLAGAVVYITWPLKKIVTCDSMPELAVMAACAAALFVFAARALAEAAGRQANLQQQRTPDRRVAASALILAALALFLSVRFIVIYRAPCTAVQHQLHGR